MAVHVHDVVQVARPASLGERAQLLPEQLDQRVTDHAVSRQGSVAVLVADRRGRGLVDEHLVGGEVELDLRQ